MNKRGGDTPADILSASLAPYTGAWTRAESAHLARRTLFGATRAEITMLAGKSMSEAVDTILTPSAKPSDPISYINISGVPQGNPWVGTKYDSSSDGARQAMLLAWWIGEMLYQGKDKSPSITEKMTLFWHNHFATGANSVKDARYMYKQNAMFRSNALGNFKSMVKNIIFDPAMLRYLNNTTNTKSHPNENLARELQELFTIGKGAEVAPGDYTNYTEADIKVIARILTGWSDVSDTQKERFTAANHDSGNKQLSARYGNAVVTGSATEAGARKEIDDLLTIIFSQDATSKYIVRKLYRWFVDYMIDDDIEQNIITPLSMILKQNNFEVKPVLDTLFKSTHFYTADIRGAVIKSPADFMLGTIRTFITPMLYPQPTEYQARYFGWRTIRKTMATMQMDLMNPPNVAGWSAYWQSPVFHELWINSDTLQKRVRFTEELAVNGYQLDENYGKTLIDVIELAKQSSAPANINTLIDELCELAYPLSAPAESKTQFKQVLLGGLPDYEWTVEWNDFMSDEQNETKRTAVENKLRAMLKYMLAMAEYQLM